MTRSLANIHNEVVNLVKQVERMRERETQVRLNVNGIIRDERERTVGLQMSCMFKIEGRQSIKSIEMY